MAILSLELGRRISFTIPPYSIVLLAGDNGGINIRTQYAVFCSDAFGCFSAL